MRLRLIAVGSRLSGWVEEGFQTYARRLPHPFQLELVEIPMAPRGKDKAAKAVEKECAQIRKLITSSQHTVALDVLGASWSTEKLSRQLADWSAMGKDINFVVGGPDGLSTALLADSQQKWSLSPLTLPHPLVRVVLAEQLYRAWSILQNHPYHRA